MVKINSRKMATILGVSVSSNGRSVVLNEIVRHLDAQHKIYIVTPNPEIVLQAHYDQELRDIINNATIAVADGVGLKLAGVLLGQGRLPIIPGRLLLTDIISVAAQRELKVFFLGTTGRVISKTLKKVRVEYANIQADGDSGPWLSSDGVAINSSEQQKETQVIKKINAFKPDVLFIAFGAPKQEKWLARHFDELNISLAMVVGGSLDYYAGEKPLPPTLVSNLGFEWLWRMLTESGHYKRVFSALIVFPFTVLVSRFFGASAK